MGESAPAVYVVDDDPGVLRALSRLLAAAGYAVRPFEASREFLEQAGPETSGCVVLDLAMPDLDGLKLQQLLTQRGCPLPVVFLTGQGDVPSSVRALKRGAVDFLTKPVEEDDLLDAIRDAFKRDREDRLAHAERAEFQRRLATLTPREREVLPHVLSGRMNKQIAWDLGTVEKTIKVHRSRLMRKLGARSLAELARMAEHAGVAPAPGRR